MHLPVPPPHTPPQGFVCTGADEPPAAPPGGFAPSVAPPRPGDLVPHGWRGDSSVASFRYRHARASGRAFLLKCLALDSGSGGGGGGGDDGTTTTVAAHFAEKTLGIIASLELPVNEYLRLAGTCGEGDYLPGSLAAIARITAQQLTPIAAPPAAPAPAPPVYVPAPAPVPLQGFAPPSRPLSKCAPHPPVFARPRPLRPLGSKLPIIGLSLFALQRQPGSELTFAKFFSPLISPTR